KDRCELAELPYARCAFVYDEFEIVSRTATRRPADGASARVSARKSPRPGWHCTCVFFAFSGIGIALPLCSERMRHRATRAREFDPPRNTGETVMAPVQRKRGYVCVMEGALAAAAIGCALPAAAFEVAAGDWTLNISGNVNVHYIHADCEEETTPGVTGGLACRGAAGEDRSSSIANGLLPAALSIGASTTQNGYDIGFTFGFFPGIATNDGSPNLQQGAERLSTALGTTALDVRQV